MKRMKIVWIIVMLIAIGSIFASPFAYNYICKNRVYDDIAQKITGDILSANVHIINCKTDGNSTSYSAGFGGVVFQKEDNKYYVLTAYHAVESLDNSTLRVIRQGDLTYVEYNEKFTKHIPLGEYYSQLPEATVEDYNELYDLAILSFCSEKNVGMLKIAEHSPQYKDRIISISQPADEKDTIITYGRITSKEPKTITFSDGSRTDNVVKHSAYETGGSSGSAVLNENCEIAGINIGGGSDKFGNFRYGFVIPSEQIKLLLLEWGK